MRKLSIEEKARRKVRSKEWKRNNKDKVNEAHKWLVIKRTYGITRDQFFKILGRQGGGCAICSDHNSRLCVDHCHATGKVRGILCLTCNFMIGHSREQIAFLEEGASYLRKHIASTGTI